MTRLVRLEESVADGILTYAQDSYPREAILILRGRAEHDEILIDEVVIPPLATHGSGFSTFTPQMLPMDFRLMGVLHSHPSGALMPSIEDLNHIYGRIMMIVAYPFRSYSNIAAFDKEGSRIPVRIVPVSRHPDASVDRNGASANSRTL